MSVHGLTGFGSVCRSGNAYDNGWARITAYDEDIIRVQAGPEGTAPQGEGYGVQKREWSDVPFELRECADHIGLVTDKLVVRLEIQALCVRSSDADGSFGLAGSSWPPVWLAE